jgi:hypothetical protein
MATTRAARPATSATSEPTGVPSCGSADTLATGLSASVCGELGATVGNRAVALPPEPSVGAAAATPGGAMADKLAPAGLADARTTMEADAAGSIVRLAALPATVRLTAVAVAVSGMATSAWNCRCAEFAYTAPRSHTDVPSPPAQPKMKVGIPVPAADCSWILASGRLPPTVQAPTAHWASCPSWLLCCRGTTPTHKLTGPVAGAAWNAVKTMAWLETLPGVALAVDVPVGVGVVGVGVGVVGVGVGVVGVGVGVVGVGVGVVGVGVGVVGVGVGVVAVGVGAAVVEVLAVGVGVDVAEAVADADAVAEAFVADALADAVASFSGSQDSLTPVAVAAAAPPLRAATTPPEAAVSRALPAIKVTARRRPCAIRIPTNIDKYHYGPNHLRSFSASLDTVRD